MLEEKYVYKQYTLLQL